MTTTGPVRHSLNPIRDLIGDGVSFVKPDEAVALLVGWLRIRPVVVDPVSGLSGQPTQDQHVAGTVRHIGVFAAPPVVGQPVSFVYSGSNDTLAGRVGRVIVMPTLVEANNAETKLREQRGLVVDPRDAYAMWYVEGHVLA